MEMANFIIWACRSSPVTTDRGEDDRAKLRVLLSADQLYCVSSVCPRCNLLQREFYLGNGTKDVVRLPLRSW